MLGFAVLLLLIFSFLAGVGNLFIFIVEDQKSLLDLRPRATERVPAAVEI